MRGEVYFGINNIYSVIEGNTNVHECRIKGKILNDGEASYNPLAPGDMVEFSPIGDGKGLINERLVRRNQLRRWNKNGEMWQIVAANLDLIAVVMSVESPPFRPRFVDRGLVCAAQNDIRAMVIVNKIDLGIRPSVEKRLAAWESIGITAMGCSPVTGEGIDALKDRLCSKTTAFFGPSGVGKSTLINTLVPGLELSTGRVSEKKHNRGRHVTNFGRMIDAPWGARLIDTPGVRELLIRDIPPVEIADFFPEITACGETCSFQPCSHRHEPDCGVITAVERGAIHPDRYQSYVNIRGELEESLQC